MILKFKTHFFSIYLPIYGNIIAAYTRRVPNKASFRYTSKTNSYSFIKKNRWQKKIFCSWASSMVTPAGVKRFGSRAQGRATFWPLPESNASVTLGRIFAIARLVVSTTNRKKNRQHYRGQSDSGRGHMTACCLSGWLYKYGFLSNKIFLNTFGGPIKGQ